MVSTTILASKSTKQNPLDALRVMPKIFWLSVVAYGSNIDRISISLVLSGIFFRNKVASGVRCAEDVDLVCFCSLVELLVSCLLLVVLVIVLVVVVPFVLEDEVAVVVVVVGVVGTEASEASKVVDFFSDSSGLVESVICDATDAAAAAAGDGLDPLPLPPLLATRLAHDPGVFGLDEDEEPSSFLFDL